MKKCVDVYFPIKNHVPNRVTVGFRGQVSNEQGPDANELETPVPPDSGDFFLGDGDG